MCQRTDHWIFRHARRFEDIDNEKSNHLLYIYKFHSSFTHDKPDLRANLALVGFEFPGLLLRSGAGETRKRRWLRPRC